MSGPVPILLLSYDLRFGGTERQLAQAARLLDRSRFAPHVGCIRLHGGRRPELERAGVPLVEFPFRSFRSLQCLAAGRKLATYIRRYRIRLLHSFDAPGTMFGIPFGFLCRVPVLLSSQRAFRELTPGMQHRLLRWTDRLADGVLVNSATLRAHLEAHDGLSPAKSTLIYNGVDLEHFQPGPGAPVLPDCPLVIGSTAMFRPEKGVTDLVEAFAVVAQRHPRLGLLLVGEGPLYEPVKARIQELGLGVRCHLAGGVTSVLPWLRRMDIFVLPSLSEAFSNSLLEAMATGCAVIASRAGGNPELVRDRETGLLFAPGDRPQLAACLEELAADAEKRQRLARAGQAFVRARFSTKTFVAALEEWYQRHLARAGVA